MYKDFDLLPSRLLEKGENKSINKIQQILSSAKAKFINEQEVSIIVDFVYMSKNHKTHYGQK